MNNRVSAFMNASRENKNGNSKNYSKYKKIGSLRKQRKKDIV